MQLPDVKLFWARGTCSLAAMGALEQARIPYVEEEIILAGDRQPLRLVSASARVPTLVLGDEVITETPAILLWIARAAPAAAMLPDDGRIVNDVSLMSWLASRVHILRRQYARPMQFCADDTVAESLKKAALPKYRAAIDELDDAVARGSLESLALRCYALPIFHWARIDDVLLDRHRALRDLVRECERVPGIAEAVSRHGYLPA